MNRREFLLDLFKKGGAVACGIAGFSIAEITYAKGVYYYHKESGGCNPATEYIGDKTDYTDSNLEYTAQTLFVQAYTPTCSGPLNTANIYYNNTIDTRRIRMAVYTKTTSAPAVEDILLSETDGEIAATTSTGYKSQTMTSYNLAEGTTYWIAILASSAGTWYNQVGNGTSQRYSKLISQDTFPDTLSTGGWTGPTDNRMLKGYITIGE
jgi:hypothetical protein